MKNFIYKTIFILFIILLYRIGSFITVPAVNPITIENYILTQGSDLLQMLNNFSGGGVSRLSILVLGIMPFITAAIIIQLLTLFVKSFKDLKESGEKGQIELNRKVKYLCFFIGAIQAGILTRLILGIHSDVGNIITTDLISFLIIFNTSCLGGIFITVWMAEKINEYGYGSGISFIIFVNIASGMPDIIPMMISLQEAQSNTLQIIIFCIAILLLFGGITIFENARKEVPLSNPASPIDKQFLPIKANLSTIMPAIFVFMLLSFSYFLQERLDSILGFNITVWLQNNLMFSDGLYWLFLYGFILLFSLIYSKSTFNVQDLSSRLKNNNTYIKGIRPNKPTEEFLNNIRIRFSYISATYLIVIIVVPDILSEEIGLSFALGGISLLILTNVALEVKKNYVLSTREKNFKNIKNEIFSKF